MLVLVQATVMTVGLSGRNKALRELPIRLMKMQSGTEAARSLKNENVDSVISKWDLEDMDNGQFLENFRAVKPDIPTIVFIKAGDEQQEIAARSLGVSAVLTDESDDELFRQTVANVLGLKRLISINTVAPTQEKKRYQNIVK